MSEKPVKVIREKVLGYKLPNSTVAFQNKDAIIYALGIGFSIDPLSTKDLCFTYELSDNFQVFPTYATSFIDISAVSEAIANCDGIPQFNPMGMLHGMHTLVFYKPIKKEGTYFNTGFIEDIQDKEKGALVVLKIDSFEDPDHKILALSNRMSLFIKGMGGFDPKREHKPISDLEIPRIPETKPDIQNEQTTSKNQALLFRLNGDFNPLHADPQMAEVGGFPSPILHGLCTYGITAKLVIDKISDYDVNFIEKVHTKFMSHLFPGETIVLKGWFSKDKASVIFEALCKERNKVIANGYVKLKSGFKPRL